MEVMTMHIDCYSNNGVPYLRVLESYSVMVDGARKNRKRTVRSIGPVSRFDDGAPDYLKRLKQSFKDGVPLIKSLADLTGEVPVSDLITIRYDKSKQGEAFSDPKNIGYFIFDALYDSLGVYDVLSRYKSDSKTEYDLNGLVKLLVFGRALFPASKIATWRDKDAYLFGSTSSENPIEVYRSLDVLDEKAEAIQKRMDHRIKRGLGRNPDVCFYDVTNYWFEIDGEDEDVALENGKVKEGLRKTGPSKAKNRKPIVQMGLFTDDSGIPVSYRVFPGNHIDQTTLRPTIKDSLDKMGFGRVIVVADGGLNSGKNICHLLSRGNGYIVSKSAKGSDKATKKWILAEEGYISNLAGTFKSKSKIRERIVTDENGQKHTIKEKIISYWSKKQYDYAFFENRKFVEYLSEVTLCPDKLKDKQPKVKKYLVETKADKKTGEVVDTVSVLSLDAERIETDLALMGYYTVITSETEMPDGEVIDKYHGLSRIENAFRVIKSDLLARPVFVRKQEHINAHFLVCFIALTMMRILQYKILKAEGKQTNSTRDWELGLSADRIKTALSGFTADALPGGYFRLTKIGDDLARIASAIDVDIALPLPTEPELRQLKYSFDKALSM